METRVSPKDIEQRVEALNAAAEQAPVETPAPEAKAPETPEAKAPEAPAEEKKVEVKVEEKKPEAKAEERKPEVKVEEKPAPEKVEQKVEKKKPNDPDELRKWNTKVSQENAALREELEKVKVAIGKLSKKPVDYAALAKDPDALAKHIEAEKAEAAKEAETKFVRERDERVKSDTELWRERYERDTDGHPRWSELFPFIQNLAATTDGRINFHQHPERVLHDMYVLADQLMPSKGAPVEEPKMEEQKVEPTPAAPAAKTYTEEEMNARIEAARKEASEKATAGLRAEENGAGLGSTGKGGRRDPNLSKEAFQKMSREELKTYLQKNG